MSDQVYLIHFATPYNGRQHYVGTAQCLDERIAEHRGTRWVRYAQPVVLADGRNKNEATSGRGATLLGAVNSAGIFWSVVRTWQGSYALENQIKGSHQVKRYCPTCKGESVC